MAHHYEFVWYNWQHPGLTNVRNHGAMKRKEGGNASARAKRVRPDLGDRAVPCKPHREVELGDVVAHHLTHTDGAGGGEPVRVWTTDPDRRGPEREGDECVRTAAHPAVEQHGC